MPGVQLGRLLRTQFVEYYTTGAVGHRHLLGDWACTKLRLPPLVRMADAGMHWTTCCPHMLHLGPHCGPALAGMASRVCLTAFHPAQLD